MGMRFGLVRVFATIMLLCSPALVMAAPNKGTSKAATAKAVSKAAVKAKHAPKVRYNGPVFAAIVVDAATGQVLSEENADTKSYPASLTKMMTLYLLFEAIERGEVQMDTLIPVSTHATQAAPSKLSLTRKSKLTVEQAIQAIVTKSANDVAVATGEKLGGGSEDAFAEKMTARAHQLGMSQTTFKNASGLPDPEQFSSARDMAMLANHLIKDFPQYYGQFSRMDFTYQGQTIHTHNRLLEFYEGADGIKTGYTAASGFNLVGSATRNGYRIIGVMFGGATANIRDRKLAQLMDQGFSVLSGAPTMAVAANTLPMIDQADHIGTQIASADRTAAPTEQGDSDQPFTPVTGANRPIETTALPPVAQPARVAALVPRTSIPKTAAKVPATATMDAFANASGVQIGAFSTRERAAAQADEAAQQLKTTFAGATAVVIPVKVKGQMVYRARIMGLEDADLMRACSLIPAKFKSGACQAIRPGA